MAFGHKYNVPAWNYDKKYDFCNTQISRGYFGELVKRTLMKHPLGHDSIYNCRLTGIENTIVVIRRS